MKGASTLRGEGGIIIRTLKDTNIKKQWKASTRSSSHWHTSQEVWKCRTPSVTASPTADQAPILYQISTSYTAFSRNSKGNQKQRVLQKISPPKSSVTGKWDPGNKNDQGTNDRIIRSREDRRISRSSEPSHKRDKFEWARWTMRTKQCCTDSLRTEHRSASRKQEMKNSCYLPGHAVEQTFFFCRLPPMEYRKGRASNCWPYEQWS